MVSTKDLYQRVAWLSGAVFAAARLGSWCFGAGGRFYYSTSPMEQELGRILRVSGCLDDLYRDDMPAEKPVFLSDAVNLTWIGEKLDLGGKDHVLVFLLGPFYFSSVSLQEIKDQLSCMDLTIAARKQMIDVLSGVPVLSHAMASQYATMLHYCMTDNGSPYEVQHISYSEPVDNSSLVHKDMEKKLDLDERDELPSSEDNVAFDRMVRSEQLIMSAVREGNQNIFQVIDNAGYSGKLQFHTGDALRDAKDTVIVFCSMCCHAAMEGGVQIRTAKRVEDTYYDHIEACSTQEELMNLNAQMMKEWVGLVQQSKQGSELSPAVQKCCDYINTNLLRSISVQSVAKEMGYSEYYFSRKFYAEKGIRLKDYINRCRVEYAKVQMVTTSKSIQEISDDLHFGTRNYFSKVFHDVVGVTPKEYRDRAGKITEQ